MERVKTLFLKVIIFIIGIPILILCVFWLPWIAKEAIKYYPGYFLYPVIICVYITAILFFYVLYQALKLLIYIDKKKAFSELSLRALTNIKYCTITISIVYMSGIPLFYFIAEKGDAPGILLIELIITFASIMIAVFSSIVQKLFKSIIDINSKNDLTTSNK